MDWQNALDADTIRQATDSDRFRQTAAFAGDDGSFENLDAFAVAFFDFQVNLDEIANFTFGISISQLFVSQSL